MGASPRPLALPSLLAAGKPNVQLHLRLRQRVSRGPQRDRRSRQVEATLGVALAAPVAHDRRNYVRTAFVNVSAAH